MTSRETEGSIPVEDGLFELDSSVDTPSLYIMGF